MYSWNNHNYSHVSSEWFFSLEHFEEPDHETIYWLLFVIRSVVLSRTLWCSVIEEDHPSPWQRRRSQHHLRHLVTAAIIKGVNEAPPPLTHLFLTDEQLISPQNHEAVLPDLSEDPFPAELPDPADLLGLSVRRRRVLRALDRWRKRTCSSVRFYFLSVTLYPCYSLTILKLLHQSSSFPQLKIYKLNIFLFICTHWTIKFLMFVSFHSLFSETCSSINSDNLLFNHFISIHEGCWSVSTLWGTQWRNISVFISVLKWRSAAGKQPPDVFVM